MGEAKRRGTKEQRAANAKEKADDLHPEAYKCSECKSEIAKFERTDARSALGIEAAYFSVCPKCILAIPYLVGPGLAVKKYRERFWEEINAQDRVIKQRDEERKLRLEDDLFWTSDDEPESEAERVERYRATFRAVLKT